MNNQEEINRAIHEAMGLCYHDIVSSGYSSRRCTKCPDDTYNGTLRDFDYKNCPDYCSDLNAVRKAEEFAIEQVGSNNYWVAINKVIEKCPEGLVSVVTATAEQRARAVLKCLGKEITE
jgi:hypothetical protein